MTAVPDEAARLAYTEFQKLYPQRAAGWDDLAEWERERWRRVVEAAAPVIATAAQEQFAAAAREVLAKPLADLGAKITGEATTAALEPVYRWLVDDLAFPFDLHTDHKPAWLDIGRLAAVWDAKDGEQPGTYLHAIYQETGWPLP